jgi:hypothetical protein
VNASAEITLHRGDKYIEVVATGTVTGYRGQVEEIFDIEALCVCGHDLWPTMTRDEERLVEDKLYEAACAAIDDAREEQMQP